MTAPAFSSTRARPRGLADEEAKARLEAEGYNDLPRAGRRTRLRILGEVLREPMLLLLIAGGVVYLTLGDLGEAALLLVFANFSVLITFLQESRTERALDALRDLASPRALVLRNGRMSRVPGREVARGDLIILSEGDRVPADCLVHEAESLSIDESLLTGESVPVSKRASESAEPPANARPGGDGQSVAYSGTLVVRGRGLAEAIATGARSEIGKIGGALRGVEEEPPRLQLEMRRLVGLFGAIAFAVCALALGLQGLVTGDWMDATLDSIALGMAMLPEEFPVVLTVFLAMGAARISRAGVLTRRSAAIESLGAATVLCSDKTGTLTENRMSIAEVRTPDEVLPGGRHGGGALSAFDELLRYGVLASAREPVDPMEKAFHERTRETAPVLVDAAITQVHGYGLTAERLAVANVWRSENGELIVAAKGAPEAISNLCRLDGDETRHVHAAAENMAKRGLRVLGVARAEAGDDPLPSSPDVFHFDFLGLVGLADPLRPEAKQAVEECRAAGVRVLMVTGDFPATARAIAGEAGLRPGRVMTGAEIAELDDARLAEALRETDIFARIVPDQKLRIVNALKAQGEVVAMTGDGVNDAPALKAAHIGVAMGGRGADVAREASAIVLLDDDFSAIVKAIRLGRRIYDNLGKAARFIIAVHVPIAGLALMPLAMGTPMLLGPAHIALLEMVIDPVCALVFEAEDEEPDVMRRPPRPPQKPLIGARPAFWGLIQGSVAFTSVAAAAFYARLLDPSAEEARSAVFAALVAVIIALVLVNRSASASLGAAFTRTNAPMAIILPIVFVAVVGAFAFPPARALLGFAEIGMEEAGAAVGAGALTLTTLEFLKWIGLGRLNARRAKR
jgi:Ca2+-transporting ATPase